MKKGAQNPISPKRLRDLRISLGWTMEDVAAAVGVSLVSVHYWEIGRCSPSKVRLIKLAEKLGTSVEFLTGQDIEDPWSDQAINDREAFLKQVILLARQTVSLAASVPLSRVQLVMLPPDEALDPEDLS